MPVEVAEVLKEVAWEGAEVCDGGRGQGDVGVVGDSVGPM